MASTVKSWLGDKSNTDDTEELLEEEMIEIGSDDEITPNIVIADQISWFTFILYFLGLKKRPDAVLTVMDESEENQTVWPERESNILSRLLFSWFSTILFVGFTQPLQHEHLWQMESSDSANYIRDKFLTNWDKDKPSLLKAFHHSFGWVFYSAAIPKVIYDLLGFVAPYLLGKIILFLGESEDSEDRHSMWYGVGLIGILILSYVIRTVLINIYFHINFRTGMHVCIFFFSKILYLYFIYSLFFFFLFIVKKCCCYFCL